MKPGCLAAFFSPQRAGRVVLRPTRAGAAPGRATCSSIVNIERRPHVGNEPGDVSDMYELCASNARSMTRRVRVA